MKLSEIRREAGDFARDIQETKILNLRDDELLSLINSGVIPTFSNGGSLDYATNKKLANGKDYLAVRPYLVCFNKTLGCKVIYPMTASKTKDKIFKKGMFQFLEVPDAVYEFVESSVQPNTYHKETHEEGSISAVDTSKGFPIFGEVLDENSKGFTIDYDSDHFKASQISEAYKFIRAFYGGSLSSQIVADIVSAKERPYMLIKGTDEKGREFYTHQFSRPVATYLAMFLNWTQYAINEGKITELTELETIKSLNELVLTSYVGLISISEQMEQIQKSNQRLYNAYTEEKTYALEAALSGEARNFEERLIDAIKRRNFDEKSIGVIKDLISSERAVERDLSYAVGAVGLFIKNSRQTIDMSSAPVDLSLLKDIQKLAKSSKRQETLKAFVAPTNAKIDSTIKAINSNRIKAKKQKEAEQAKRRAEAKAREDARKTKTELVNENLLRALKLYAENYKDVMTDASSGKLFEDRVKGLAHDFITLFTNYNSNNSELREFLEDVDRTNFEDRLVKQVVNLSNFVPRIAEDLEIIEGGDNAKAFQDYISGKTKVLEGENDQTTQNTIDLFNIIHSELTRTVNVSKKTQASEEKQKEVLARIQQRVLKDKDKFSDVDLTPDSKARTNYLDEAVDVGDSEFRILELNCILALYKASIDAIRNIAFAYRTVSATENAIANKCKTILSEKVCDLILQTKDPEQAIANVEREIFSMIMDKNLNSIDAVGRIEKLAKELVGKHCKRQAELIDFDRCIDGFGDSLDRVGKRIPELYNAIPEFLAEEKKRLGIASDFCLIDGRKFADKDAFKVLEDHKDDNGQEIKTITDAGLVGAMCGKALVDAHDYAKRFASYLNNSNDWGELLQRAQKRYSESINYPTALENDFNYLISQFCAVVNAFNDLEIFTKKAYEVRKEYFVNLVPYYAGDKEQPMLPDDVIERLHSAVEPICREREDIEREANEKFLEDVMKKFIVYVASLPRRGESAQIEDIKESYSVETISDKTKTVDQNDKELFDFLGIADTDKWKLKILISEVHSGKTYEEIVTGGELESVIDCMLCPLLFEYEFELVKMANHEGVKPTGLYAMGEILRYNELKSKVADLQEILLNPGVPITDRLYEYLAHGVARLGKYYAEHKNLYHHIVSAKANKAMVMATEMVYKNWLGRLDDVEKELVDSGKLERITEGRDLELEAKIKKIDPATYINAIM